MDLSCCVVWWVTVPSILMNRTLAYVLGSGIGWHWKVITYKDGWSYLCQKFVIWNVTPKWSSLSQTGIRNNLILSSRVYCLVCLLTGVPYGSQQTDAQNESLQEVDCNHHHHSSASDYTLPNEADFLIACATVQGFVSYRSKSRGSWFINKLVETLENHHHRSVFNNYCHILT